MENDTILSVEHLTKSFGDKKSPVLAVNDVSLTVRSGETLGVVGESGCGKTTLGRCIVRGIDPSFGKVEYTARDGSKVDLAALDKKGLKPIRKDIQMIFQDPYSSLDPRMTVYDIIAEPLRANYGYDSKTVEQKVFEIAEMTGLSVQYLRRYPHAFSGGQRQRVGIARALITLPRIIVCDEAVSALDVSIQAQIINLLKDLQERLGLTYLFISHALSVVEYISDRVAVMYLGRIVETSETNRLFGSPLHPYTEALLSAAPKPDPDIAVNRIVLRGEVPNPARPPKGCHFHPRCPYAQDICSREAPPLREIEPGHMCACHRGGELRLRGVRSKGARA